MVALSRTRIPPLQRSHHLGVMRLINCATLQFEEFIGKNIPPYWILSHTWETYEISYKEYCGLGDPRLKPGPQAEKILKTCDIATEEGYNYVCKCILA